jgi:hypothetical protein
VISRTQTALAAVLAVVSACGHDSSPAPGSTIVIELVDLPALFGHQTVTHVTATDPAGIMRVELYLDDMRIGAAEFAPFDVYWDASGFGDGAHRLRAVAYTADGRTGSSEVVIQIDHMPPVVVLPELAATRDGPFVVTATDPAGVAQIVVLRGSQPVATLTAAPYQFAWPGGACGAVELHIVATDQLGNQIDVVKTVDAVDTHDLDCDGEPAIRFGGADCDDTSASFGPHAPDPGGSLADFNCDGIPGVDADHDGVPSVATGGTDCDDASRVAHGIWPGWTGVSLDSGASTPAPAFVALDATFADQVLAFVGSDGGLRSASAPLAPSAPVLAQPEVVADGVDTAADRHPAVLGPDNTVVIAYFAGTALRLATRGAAQTSWTVTEIDPGTDSRLRHVELVDDSQRALHVVYEAGDDASPHLNYATNRSGTWTIETVPDGSPAQDALIGLDQFLDSPVVVYKNSTGLRRAEKVGSSWGIQTLFADRQRLGPYTIGANSSLKIDTVFAVTAADHDEVQLARPGSLTRTIATVPDRVTQLVVTRAGEIVAQVTPRAGGTAAVGIVSSTGAFLQKLQDGEIVGATRSLHSTLNLILGASGQPLRLARVTGAVLPGALNCGVVP